MKKALITGITGQDGSYLAELLLAKGYEVHGVIRRASHLQHQPNRPPLPRSARQRRALFLHYGDLADSVQMVKLLYELQPDEIYNLGAQSHVRVSFDIPEYTGDVDGLGTQRILEAIREAGLVKKVRFYQASSSEMFGKVQEVPQTETTPFWPRSPYGVRQGLRLLAHRQLPRELRPPREQRHPLQPRVAPPRARPSSPARSPAPPPASSSAFRTSLYLGNLDARRDWGYAKEYVEMMWLMLQQDQPDDYVVATNETHSVREFCQEAFGQLGLDWQQYVKYDPATSGPPRSTCSSAIPPRPRGSWAGTRRCASRNW